jgi:hypothetical protein
VSRYSYYGDARDAYDEGYRDRYSRNPYEDHSFSYDEEQRHRAFDEGRAEHRREDERREEREREEREEERAYEERVRAEQQADQPDQES